MHRQFLTFALVSLSLAALPAALAQPTPAPPLEARLGFSAADRRDAKPALESRQLDDMESPAAWSVFGPGRMTLTSERARTGKQSLRLTSPTKLSTPAPTPGRPFAEAGVRRRFEREDWSRFNRITVEVYPRLSGFRTISILLKLHGVGTESWPYTQGHLHHALVKGDRWNRVVWEIPHLPLNLVTGFDLIYRLQGNEPDASSTVQFDFDDLRLERVAQPDPYHGWQVAPGTFAYSHLGYASRSRKIAVAAPGFADFEIVGVGLNTPAFRAPAQALTNELGAFSVLDFSKLDLPGIYQIKAGTNLSAPFLIGTDPRLLWQPTLAATLNHYRCQRCGEAVPGIHRACHADWRVTHGNRSLPLAGGWHDAGDLSQGLVNTSEAVEALLDASALNPPPPPPDAAGVRDRLSLEWKLLNARTQLEGRWGLDWILSTRFGDGHRATWATMDYWTDGVPGNADDTPAPSGDSPFDNLVAAAAEATAAAVFSRSDTRAATAALRAAEEDWQFAAAKADFKRTETLAAAIHAAVRLHRVTEKPLYRDRAVELARALLTTQQAEPIPSWTLPLTGYFHTGTDRQRPLTYEHRGHHQAPVVALVELCETFPSHPDVGSWREAVRLHAEYLLQTARLSAPWELPAAGIYRTTDGDANYLRQVREGIRLDDTHFLRRFPVWNELRGNSGVLLSQARALSAAASLLGDPRLTELAWTQLEWHLGRNPFAQSLMYGIGHNYTPQYSAMSGNIVGGLPVGIQTRGADDIPYWPASTCYNYAEIWVHSSTRFLTVLTDLLKSDVPR